MASQATTGGGQLDLQVQSTSDDGRHWRQSARTRVALTEVGASLALKSDDGGDVAWLVTPLDLWLSRDGGRTWITLTPSTV